MFKKDFVIQLSICMENVTVPMVLEKINKILEA